MKQELTFTIIFTKQDNTTVEMEIKAEHDLYAARKANDIVAENEFKNWEFADGSFTTIGTL